MKNIKYCKVCCNARVFPELDDYNDGSSTCVGKSLKGISLFISSGDAKPVRIEVLQYNDKIKENQIVALYEPKYCPECGRKLDEYKRRK